MPVTRMGPWCSRCGLRPAITDGLCRPCECLLRAFGLAPVGELSAEEEFDAELNQALRRWSEAA